MSIRLSKAIRELNIGLQTAVEYLEKKTKLGEIRADLSFKLSDEQYEALKSQFSKDQEVHNQAANLFLKKPKEKEKKREEHTPKEEQVIHVEVRQQYKPLGKIDLDPKPEEPTPAPTPSPEPAQNTEESEGTAPVVEETAEEEVVEEVVESAESQEPVEEPQEEEEEKEQAAPSNDGGLHVLGKIDLDSLNQSTRPKKKTKEERRKEREEKSAQQGAEKKKRQRIRNERVDIEAAGKQPQQGKNHNNNNNNNQQQGGSNKKKNKKRQKSLEVNEEDVARQVKETLARLTSKTSQNKKGAK